MNELTQAEADALLAMHKRRRDDTEYGFPGMGGRLNMELESLDRRELFSLDVSRGRIQAERQTFQNRGRQTIILARLDFGVPHRNPDGTDVGVPHLHLYREGFGDKWAFPVPADRFPTPNDHWRMLSDFMAFCNIVEPPRLIRGLFT